MTTQRAAIGRLYLVIGVRSPRIESAPLLSEDEIGYDIVRPCGGEHRIRKSQLTRAKTGVFYCHADAAACQLKRLQEEVDRAQRGLDAAWAAVKAVIAEGDL